MHRFSIAISFILIAFNLASGQLTINGKILERKTQEAIPYANIGIPKSSVGTLSNPDGSFSIFIPLELGNDTLRFSALGFSEYVIPLRSFAPEKEVTIYLDEKAIVLNPVTVLGKKEANKRFELGNPVFKGGVLETDTTYAGRSVSLLIENKEPHVQKGFAFPVYLEKATLRIFRNNLGSFKFRIRLNKVDSLTSQPGEDFLHQSIVVESSMKNGWMEFDLSHLNLQVSRPFFITFEQILDLKDRTAIADGYRDFMSKHPERLRIDTVVFNGKKEIRQTFTRGGIDLPGTFIGISNSKSAGEQYVCFARETSFAEWKKVRGIVAATVTVSNQPTMDSPKE